MKLKFGNLITGAGAGVLLGYALLTFFSINSLTWLILGLFGAFFTVFAYRHPVASETWAIVLSVALLFIVVGNALSTGTGFSGLNYASKYLFWGAIGLLVLNLLTGDLRIRSVRRRGRRILTIGYRTLGRN